MARMSPTRTSARLVVLVLAAVAAVALASTAACAQGATPTTTTNVTTTTTVTTNVTIPPQGNDTNETGPTPLWLMIQNAIQTHAYELRDRMFLYRINNTANASEQAQLIRARNMELHNATMQAQVEMQAMVLARQAGETTQAQFVAAVHLIHGRISGVANGVNSIQNVARLHPGVLSPQQLDALALNVSLVNAETVQHGHGQGNGQGQGNNK